MRKLATMAFACMLAGCGTKEIPLSRVDGQTMRGNPTLEKQFSVDDTICQGEVAKAISGSQPEIRSRAAEDVYRGCMAQRGYMAAL